MNLALIKGKSIVENMSQNQCLNSGILHNMNSRARVIEAFKLNVPDIIPFHAYESPENAIRLLVRKVHEMDLEPELIPQTMINSARLYSNDIVYMRPGKFVQENIRLEMIDDMLVWKDHRTGEIYGHVLYDLKDFIPAVLPEPLVKSAADVDKIPFFPYQELLQRPEYQSLKAYIREFKGEKFLFSFACGQSANALYTYMGTEAAMIATITDPGLCHAIMERRNEAIRHEILALKELGADGIYTGDACASCSFYSPATYRTMFFEHQRKSIEFVHAAGMKALLHVCGKISMILENMTATGADVIESLDAFSSGGDIELKDAKKRVGGRVCLKGNIDAVHVLETLSPEKIYEICMQALNDAGPNGYILSTEQITRGTPIEHVMAMLQARDDYSSKMLH